METTLENLVCPDGFDVDKARWEMNREIAVILGCHLNLWGYGINASWVVTLKAESKLLGEYHKLLTPLQPCGGERRGAFTASGAIPDFTGCADLHETLLLHLFANGAREVRTKTESMEHGKRKPRTVSHGDHLEREDPREPLQ